MRGASLGACSRDAGVRAAQRNTQRHEEDVAVAERDDFNKRIIDEFRQNKGKVGGPFNGAPMLLLHTRGARTGTERVNPVVYQQLDDGSLAIFASKAGAPTNPDWFHNLVANPEVEIEVGPDRRRMRARVAGASERRPIWEKQKTRMPGFSDYEKTTTRTIPVVILEPAS
jgi:deazaflavin-dependent oxidoreductase (nitroreductase family)